MCKNPEVPVYDGQAFPAGPLRCANCGGELTLACDGPRGRAPKAPRKYKPRPCARCLRTFQPTGPHSLYCGRDDCQPADHPPEV